MALFGSKDQAAASLPETRTVGKYTVHKLPLNAYVPIFSRLKTLPGVVNNALGGDTSEENILRALPDIITAALPEVTELLSVVTRVPAPDLEAEMDLDTAVDVAIAAIELNNFLGVWSKLQALPEKLKLSGAKK